MTPTLILLYDSTAELLNQFLISSLNPCHGKNTSIYEVNSSDFRFKVINMDVDTFWRNNLKVTSNSSSSSEKTIVKVLYAITDKFTDFEFLQKRVVPTHKHILRNATHHEENIILTHTVIVSSEMETEEFAKYAKKTMKSFNEQWNYGLEAIIQSQLTEKRDKAPTGVTLSSVTKRLFPRTKQFDKLLTHLAREVLDSNICISIWDYSTALCYGNSACLNTSKVLVAIYRALDNFYDVFQKLRDNLRDPEYRLGEKNILWYERENKIIAKPLVRTRVMVAFFIPKTSTINAKEIEIRVDSATAIVSDIISYGKLEYKSGETSN